MTAAERSCHLNVSEYYFRLTSESVRLYSNSVLKHSTLDQVVNDRADRAATLPENYSSADMKEHLDIIPSEGPVGIDVTILETSAASIDGALPALEKALGTSVAFADALSLILYDFVVERNATEILTKLGLNSEEAKRYRKAAKKTETNVLPFR